MQLTRFTDLGLRALMYLAQYDGADAVTSAEIAAQFRVPQNHVNKVVHKLGKLGWIDTLRGRHGGLRLAVDPARLNLGVVMRALEGTATLVNCAEPPCVLRHGCLLKGALDDALEVFYAELDRHTLADLCKQRTRSTLINLQRQRARI